MQFSMPAAPPPHLSTTVSNGITVTNGAVVDRLHTFDGRNQPNNMEWRLYAPFGHFDLTLPTPVLVPYMRRWSEDLSPIEIGVRY